MPIRRAVPLFLAIALAGCGRPGAAPSPAPPASGQSGDAVVAEVDGERITAAELDRHAAGQLQQVRDQEYEIRRNALDDLIGQRLIEKRARERGMTAEELKRQEVDSKVQPPTAAEIDAIYDQNRDRVGGRSRDQVAPQIISSLTQQRIAERNQAFTNELRGSAAVTILLEQPRAEVPVAAGAQARGPAQAPVTIVEYSDYLCPYCQRAEETVARVLARYEGKVRFVHRDLLIGRPRSMAVARAALCAGEQGKFWEYRANLLSGSGDWSDVDLGGRAIALGLNAADFRSCLASDRHEKAVLDSTEEGQKLGVSGTPTFFINGRRMVGVRSEADLERTIQAELARRG
jgi:protein-disulfide isomerase